MSLRQMLLSMTASEYAEWYEYYKLEPFGEERSDWRSGNVCATLANVNRGKKGRSYKPTDFMPKFKEGTDKDSVQRLTPEQSVKYAKLMSAMINLRNRNAR